jgi:hypothetical protein
MRLPACKTEILFRVWTCGAESKKLPTDEAAARRQGAIAFIEDIIASRKGVLVATDDNFFVSILDSPSEALVVSRQVQLGMRGFQDKSVNQPVAISISIDADTQNTKAVEASENPPAKKMEASHDLLTLIRMSKPDQVLLTHDLFQHVTPFKGLPLKPFQGRFGVFEYLWTSEEKLVALQSRHGHFVDSIEERSQQSETPELAGFETHIPSEENAGTQLSPAAFSAKTSDGKRLLRSPWSIATIVTLLLVIIVVAGITLRTKKPAAQPPVTTTNQVPRPAPPTSPLAPVTQPPAAKANTQLSGVDQKTPAAPTRPRDKSDSAHVKNKAVADTAPPKAECKLPSSLKSYLSLAEGYREQGKYTDAERVFRLILDCDPNNPEAIQGLSRTRAAEQ